MAATSALTGPSTSGADLGDDLSMWRPDLAISVGLVVTPSTRPVGGQVLEDGDVGGVEEELHGSTLLVRAPLVAATAAERKSLRMSRIASVLLPMPLPEAFDYAEPEGMELALGDQVAVPLGPRLLRGVVVGLREAAGGNRPLKPVRGELDEPRLPPGTVEFVEWAARYAVDCAGPAAGDRAARRARAEAAAGAGRGAHRRRSRPGRRRRGPKVLEAAAGQALSPADLARAAGVSSGRGQGAGRRGRAGGAAASRPRPRFDAPDPDPPGRDAQPQPGGRGRRAEGHAGRGRLRRRPARRRHRLGQDRGLSGGGRRGAGRRSRRPRC